MKTIVRDIADEEHRALCCLVGSQLLRLEWRHNGIGCLQAYIQEGAEQEMRVHIWHESLRRDGIQRSGLFHDHRFDLLSYVLVGAIEQHEIEPLQAGPALVNDTLHIWRTYKVLHARAAAEKTGGKSFHQEPELQPERYIVNISTRYVREGEVYFYPKREFHGTEANSAVSEYTITLMIKSNQDETPARILAPEDKPLVNAFSDPLPEEAWRHHIPSAQALLHRRWLNGRSP